MTTQAQPDYNAALADARKATETAQALADDYRLQIDMLRNEVQRLMHVQIELERELMTLRNRQDVLQSELGEANQSLTVMEEKTL